MTSPSDGNLPVTGEFPVQKACNGENASISWWTAIYTFDVYRLDIRGRLESYKLGVI